MLALKTLAGASLLVGSRLLSRVIDFFTLLVLARVLTPADFGIAALATSFVVILDTVLEIPVTQALLRLPSIEKSHLDTGFTLSIVRSLALAVIAISLALPFSIANHDRTLIPLIMVLAIGPVSKGLASPAMVYFSRDLKFLPAFVIELTGKICACAVVALTLLCGGSYWAIVVNFSSASAVATLLSYVAAPYRPRLSLKRASDFNRFIGWFSAAQLVSALNWQFDKLFIGFFAGKPALGRYSVANDLSVMPTQSIIGPAMQPVMAAFSRVVADEPERINAAFLKAVRFVMAISVPACLGISVTSDLLTHVLLGPQWTNASPILSILALSILPGAYFQVIYAVSVALDKPNSIFKLNLTEISLKLLAVPLGYLGLAVLGVALARVGMAAVMFFIYLVHVKYTLRLGVLMQLSNVGKISVAGLLMYVSVYAMHSSTDLQYLSSLSQLFIVSTLGAAIYISALTLMGGCNIAPIKALGHAGYLRSRRLYSR